MLTEATVGLVPARWTALFAAFGGYEDAVAVARRLATIDPRPRSLSVDDPGLVACFPTDPGLDRARYSLRAIIDVENVVAVSGVVAGAGGQVLSVRPEAVGLLVSLSYNHVTLGAKRRWPDACHVHVGGPALVAHHAEVRTLLPGGLLHHDAMAPGGTLDLGGLLIGRFPGDDALAAAMDRLRVLGAHVTDPHTWQLGQHGDLTPLHTTAARFDPARLLNPGKLPPPA